MRYEIDFLSRSGNTKKLADAIEGMLPVRDTEFIDLLSDEPTTDADAYVIVFSFNKGTIPLKIMEMLDMLEGKTMLFLVTLGADTPEDYHEAIEQKLKPFMPSDCDYRGLYLCKGAFPESVIEAAEEQLQKNPDNEYAHMVRECCKQANGHPDQNDLDSACAFVRSKLEI